MRTVIIEDNQDDLELIKLIIKGLKSDIDIVATAASVQDGIATLNQYKPDLTFMDIRIQGGTAFDILHSLYDWDFEIILTTFCDNYAVDAVDARVVDYVCKPLSSAKICRAVQKAKQLIIKKQNSILPQLPQKLIVNTDNSSLLIDHNEITGVKSKDGYCSIYRCNNTKVNTSMRIKDIEDKLQNTTFFRTNRSNIININFVAEYQFNKINLIKLQNSTTVPIAKSNVKAFKATIAKFFGKELSEL